jgi:hypothetical protein
MQAHPALVLNADFRPLSGRPSYWRETSVPAKLSA